MLEMRESCERCEAPLPGDGAAVICSFECTFCTACGEQLDHRCPNCAGELVPRPRRASAMA
ncbi:MAG: DUF1272 domain-containing protein [Actinobacteria bacterium]|nr:DUF1272 domain-containing protein [Actinomycetota bacterium]MTA78742.1 DUF1272 domain-containing protein [Actinomycetota bacterium]